MNGEPTMSQDAPPTPPSRPTGNIGVPIGCILLLVCFFLPWITMGSVSALELSTDRETAVSAFAHLQFSSPLPMLLTRGLWVVPLLALLVLWTELTIPSGRLGRRAVRIAVFAVAGVAAFLFIRFGLDFGTQLAYGFWGSLMGDLFITVGELFNVLRDE
jgi:hypothetical protein